jgi:hypothetical protein
MRLKWDKNIEGNIALTPLVDFEAVDLYGLGVGLRLEMSDDPGQPNKATKCFQTAMSVDQAEGLIEILRLSIDYIQAARPKNPPN